MSGLLVTISVPEHVTVEPKPRTVVVHFSTNEEKQRYVYEEGVATVGALKAFARAWTKEEREKAYVQVYEARKNFHNVWSNKHQANHNSSDDQLA
jgi:hypothetical protein